MAMFKLWRNIRSQSLTQKGLFEIKPLQACV
jgi:hypothetical protein